VSPYIVRATRARGLGNESHSQRISSSLLTAHHTRTVVRSRDSKVTRTTSGTAAHACTIRLSITQHTLKMKKKKASPRRHGNPTFFISHFSVLLIITDLYPWFIAREKENVSLKLKPVPKDNCAALLAPRLIRAPLASPPALRRLTQWKHLQRQDAARLCRKTENATCAI
jgi:hypothetical protein